MFLLSNILLSSRFVTIIVFFLGYTQTGLADSFSEFGIIRANIARDISGHQWLVCCETKRGIDKGELVRSEAVGVNADGDIFRIRGVLRPGRENLLSLESYIKPSVAFSTKEGYFYMWNTLDDKEPFEHSLNIKEYEKIIKKFELYSLFGDSKDGPVKFNLLKENPEFYNFALALPRPKSIFHLENPTAKRLRVGIVLTGISNTQCIVQNVLDGSAAAAAGIKPNDVIVGVAINGTNVQLEKCFPIPNNKSIRILSFKIRRISDENRIVFSDINIFLPSFLESFLFK
jgi:PDZ domain